MGMNGMYNYDKIRNELEDYLGGYSKDYDIPEIMAELRDYVTEDGECITSIDDVHPDDFADILTVHEK